MLVCLVCFCCLFVVVFSKMSMRDEFSVMIKRGKRLTFSQVLLIIIVTSLVWILLDLLVFYLSGFGYADNKTDASGKVPLDEKDLVRLHKGSDEFDENSLNFFMNNHRKEWINTDDSHLYNRHGQIGHSAAGTDKGDFFFVKKRKQAKRIITHNYATASERPRPAYANQNTEYTEMTSTTMENVDVDSSIETNDTMNPSLSWSGIPYIMKRDLKYYKVMYIRNGRACYCSN